MVDTNGSKFGATRQIWRRRSVMDFLPRVRLADCAKQKETPMTAPPLPDALNMQGKRVLVTGAASGIGRATALVLAQLGATLLITDRAPLEETRDEVAAVGVTCEMARGDLTDDMFLTALFMGERL